MLTNFNYYLIYKHLLGNKIKMFYDTPCKKMLKNKHLLTITLDLLDRQSLFEVKFVNILMIL